MKSQQVIYQTLQTDLISTLNLACVDAMKETRELEKFRSMFNTRYIHLSSEN